MELHQWLGEQRTRLARGNDVAPRAWLADVLRRIADHPAVHLDELLPWNYARQAAKLAA